MLLYWSGKLAEALKSHESARKVRQKLADDNPTVSLFQGELAASYGSIGFVLGVTSKRAEALESYAAARCSSRSWPTTIPPSPGSRTSWRTPTTASPTCTTTPESPPRAPVARVGAHDLSEAGGRQSLRHRVRRWPGATQDNIGIMLHESGKPAEALPSLESHRKFRQKLADDNPSVTWYQEELRAAATASASACAIGKPAEALESYKSALLIWQKMARDHPESPVFQSSLGLILNNFAMIELDAKRFEQARDLLRKAIESQRKALAVYPANTGFRRPMDAQLSNLIKAYRGLNDAEGGAEAEQELAKFRRLRPGDGGHGCAIGRGVQGRSDSQGQQRASPTGQACV